MSTSKAKSESFSLPSYRAQKLTLSSSPVFSAFLEVNPEGESD